MVKFRLLMILFVMLLVACGATPSTIEVTEPVVIEETAVPPTTLPTPIIENEPTSLPEPVADSVDAFIERLQLAVTTQNYTELTTLTTESIGVGGWRSQWRMYDPEQLVAELQNGSLPLPKNVTFTGSNQDELTALLGQPPQAMLGPTANVAAVLHSQGWGQDATGEAILFVVEEDGQYAWSAFLYTEGSFASANSDLVYAPIGLVYRVVGDGVYQIGMTGEPEQLLNEQQAMRPNLVIAPNGRQAAHLDDERKLWVINTETGEEKQMATDVELSHFLAWGDSTTLIMGVWFNFNEADGPNNGHIATLDTNSGTLTILDEEHLASNRPALSADGRIAFSVYTPYLPSRIYSPESGINNFDPSDYSSTGSMVQGNALNPTWSPDGTKMSWLVSTGERVAVQIFDLEAQTAVQLHDWDAARFGGFIPAPSWSADGKWLLIEILAHENKGSGVWLLATDGSEHRLIEAQGSMPYWVNASQLVLHINNIAYLYDVDSGQSFPIDLPAGSYVMTVIPAELLSAENLDSANPVVETTVMYIMAMQDVVMYSRPDETANVIGGIFDGQQALVTGQDPDGGWWRVICPDDTVGDCWVTADTTYTIPTTN